MASIATGPSYLGIEFDELFKNTLKEWKIPGASLAVIEGEEIYTRVHGVIRPDGPKVTENTLFNVASMSKSFTASAVALLVDDDTNYPQVRWDTIVSELMPEDFVLPDPYLTQNVTITDMLTHRTGMPCVDEFGLNEKSKNPSTPQSIVRSLRHLHGTRPLRTEAWYSNEMFTSASYLVEKVTGKRFGDFLKERFWEPLGMHRTFLALENLPDSVLRDPENKADAAIGCRWDKGKEAYVELPDTLAPEGQGAGNIQSSAKEYGLWVQANILGTHAVSEDSMKMLTKPHIFAAEQGEGLLHLPIFYGMGWVIQYYRGYKVISHSGGVPGFTCEMIWIPTKKWGAVILGNSCGIDEASSVVLWTLIDSVLDIPAAEKSDWAQIRRDKFKEEKAEDAAKANEPVFKDCADPPLPMPLPLEAYAGCYSNPAYHELTFEIKDGVLFVDAFDRVFAYTMTLEHVSSNFFVAVRHDSFEEIDDMRLKAEFEVGVNGKVKRLGIDFVNEEWSEYTWFTKIE